MARSTAHRHGGRGGSGGSGFGGVGGGALGSDGGEEGGTADEEFIRRTERPGVVELVRSANVGQELAQGRRTVAPHLVLRHAYHLVDKGTEARGGASLVHGAMEHFGSATRVAGRAVVFAHENSPRVGLAY
jgi:hypothetical protein